MACTRHQAGLSLGVILRFRHFGVIKVHAGFRHRMPAIPPESVAAKVVRSRTSFLDSERQHMKIIIIIIMIIMIIMIIIIRIIIIKTQASMDPVPYKHQKLCLLLLRQLWFQAQNATSRLAAEHQDQVGVSIPFGLRFKV